MSCQVEGHTHTCPRNLLSLPLLPCGRHRALGQILPRCVTWANDVHCLDLSLLPSELGRRMLAGPISGSCRTTGLAGGPAQKMLPIVSFKVMQRTGLPGTPGPRIPGTGFGHSHYTSGSAKNLAS